MTLQEIRDRIMKRLADRSKYASSYFFLIPDKEDPNQPDITIRVANHPGNWRKIRPGPVLSFISDGIAGINMENEWIIDRNGYTDFGLTLLEILSEELPNYQIC
jgi:hypothetical protein